MLDTFLTPPLVWGTSPSVYTPHSFIGFPVHWYVSGISVCHMGIFPLCWGFGGVPPSVGGSRGHQHMGCPYAHSCTYL